MIELKFLKELMLIRQANERNMMSIIIVFLNKGFTFQPNVCHRCHNLFMISINLSDIASFEP